MTGTNSALDNPSGKLPGTRISFARYLLRLFKVALAAAFLILCVLAGGFFHFATKVGWSQPPKDPRGDGMVVLTGGAKRIETALVMLSEGAASKLLISGVAAQTSSQDLANRYKNHADLFNCCVDLDKGAENTVGNGTQTGRWIRDNNFKSVLVVTSAYHLPRAMIEVAHSSSQTDLIGVPVVHSGLNLQAWYQDLETTQLMVREYAKYLAALARIAFKRGYRSLL